MKGHLEIFENRLKEIAKGLLKDKSAADSIFLDFEKALGETIAFYDVQSGVTLADYYQSQFIQFVKSSEK